MFWKKRNHLSELPVSHQKVETEEAVYPYPERECWLYISSKYKEILFVPLGRVDKWHSRELDEVLVRDWPMNIGELQECIEQTLNNWKDPVPQQKVDKDHWPSFNSSKARTQHSFHVDYVQILLTTDLERSYQEGEVERILVKAAPFDWNDDNYLLIGRNHLIETQVAQVVLDIINACEKIRTA